MLNRLLLCLTIKLFLGTFYEEEYQIITHQKWLIKPFCHLLTTINQHELKNLKREHALIYAAALHKGGNIYRRMSTPETLQLAIVYHTKALELRRAHLNEHALDIGRSYLDLGAGYNELKGKENNEKALEYYQKALPVFERHGQKAIHLKASTFNNLANAWRDLDDAHIPRSLDYLTQALAIFSRLPEARYKKEIGKIYYNIGMNHHGLGGEENLLVAISHLKNAHAIFDSLHDNARLALTLSYLGDVYRTMGTQYLHTAAEHLQKALAIQKKIYETDHHPHVAQTQARLDAVLAAYTH